MRKIVMIPARAIAKVAGRILRFSALLLKKATNPHFTKVFDKDAIVMAFTVVTGSPPDLANLARESEIASTSVSPANTETV